MTNANISLSQNNAYLLSDSASASSGRIETYAFAALLALFGATSLLALLGA